MIRFAVRLGRLLARGRQWWVRLVLAVACATSLAAQRGVTPGAPQAFVGGVYEASGVVAVAGGSSVLMVDDGRPQHVYLMTLTAAGTQQGDLVPIRLPVDVPDMEDITSDGRYFYVVGSQSQRGGRETDGLVRFRFDLATRAVSDVQRVTGLRELLADAVPDLRGRGRGAGGGLNIEGLVWDPAGERLLLGLRSPMLAGRAVVLALRLRDPSKPLENSNLMVDDAPIAIDLGGDAIRGMGYDADSKQFLLLTGASTYGRSVDFRLLEWNGRSATGLRLRSTFPAAWKPEGVARMRLGAGMRTIIVFDAGGFLVTD